MKPNATNGLYNRYSYPFAVITPLPMGEGQGEGLLVVLLFLPNQR